MDANSSLGGYICTNCIRERGVRPSHVCGLNSNHPCGSCTSKPAKVTLTACIPVRCDAELLSDFNKSRATLARFYAEERMGGIPPSFIESHAVLAEEVATRVEKDNSIRAFGITIYMRSQLGGTSWMDHAAHQTKTDENNTGPTLDHQQDPEVPRHSVSHPSKKHHSVEAMEDLQQSVSEKASALFPDSDRVNVSGERALKAESRKRKYQTGDDDSDNEPLARQIRSTTMLRPRPKFNYEERYHRCFEQSDDETYASSSSED